MVQLHPPLPFLEEIQMIEHTPGDYMLLLFFLALCFCAIGGIYKESGNDKIGNRFMWIALIHITPPILHVWIKAMG